MVWHSPYKWSLWRRLGTWERSYDVMQSEECGAHRGPGTVMANACIVSAPDRGLRGVLPKQRVGSDHFFLSSKWYLKLLHGPLMNEKCKKREKPFFPWRNPICPRNVLSFVKLCLHEVFSKGLFQPTGSAVGNPGFCFQPCWQTEDGPHACPLTFLLWSWEGSTCCCHLD